MKELANLLKNMVPAERIELSRAQGPRDFESRASTSFTTPACNHVFGDLPEHMLSVSDKYYTPYVLNFK